ncbi:MAG TPA: MBL fold metallo-hydrolase [Bellilinea sp.]|nr:MBL fold metallo-hydrolase [Bellilinea sp.]
MKIRYLGHSCVEILGKHHILIDPDFTHPPLPDVEFICVSHAHKDHIGKIASVSSGLILAAPDVCEIAHKMGIPASRLKPVKAGEQIENIKILPGFSAVKDLMYIVVNLFFRFRLPDPGGTPLSFLIQDEADLLHIGDAHEAPLTVRPDILCLPWRTTPFGSKRYKSSLIRTAKQFDAPYILPIHFDLPGTEASPLEIRERISATVLIGENWHSFHNKKEVLIN